MASNKRSSYLTDECDRYRQGDILKGLEVIEWAEVVDQELVVRQRVLPYAVVLSQECDLEHDFNNRGDLEKPTKDKYLPTILVCPAYPATQLKLGQHLEELGLNMQVLGGDQWKRLKLNGDYRYHFLREDQENQLPDLVIDFKHFFTVPRDILYRDAIKKTIICSLDDLFREHLSSRFAHYLSRIGLPELESA